MRLLTGYASLVFPVLVSIRIFDSRFPVVIVRGTLTFCSPSAMLVPRSKRLWDQISLRVALKTFGSFAHWAMERLLAPG